MLVAVPHDARQLHLVHLAAGYHHVVAAHRHRAVGVCRLLEVEFTLQQRVPLDHAGGLPVGRDARGHGGLAARGTRHDGGRGQGQAGPGSGCRVGEAEWLG